MPQKRADPFKDLLELQERMHRILIEAFLNAGDGESTAGAWTPSIDVYETGDEVVVLAELPGLSRDDVEIRLEHGSLILQGERRMNKDVKEENYQRVERRFGKFSRSIAMPPEIDSDEIEAELRSGVLRISVPKTGAGKRKSIEIPIG